MRNPHTLIVGVGNRHRGDDAFGCLVAAGLAAQLPPGAACIEHDGEPAGLMECWRDVEKVILIDAVSSGAEPGRIHRFDLAERALPDEFNLYSTHAFGVPQAVELARTLGRLPPEVRFIGVEGGNFDAGNELTPELSAAKEAVIAEISASLESDVPAGALVTD